MRYLISICILFASSLFAAGASDTLQVLQEAGTPYFLHPVQRGDDLNLLAKKYNVPIARLAGFNKIGFQEGLERGSQFKIPIIPNNYRRVAAPAVTKPVYYIIQQGDNLKSVSRLFKVAQSTLQLWNQMPDNSVRPGQQLFTGWVTCNDAVKAFASEKEDTISKEGSAGRITAQTTDSTRIALIDSIAQPVLAPAESNEFELLYEEQTAGRATNDESGAAVFYPLKMRVKKGIYYAFHNTAPRGAILKIHNPASGKVIYAKVLGPIPELGEYQHAIVTISNNAIGVLDAKDKRMFCKVYYK